MEEKDLKVVWSYRPVALINILCKIFERMTNRDCFGIWRRKKIDDRQFGFRKESSTINAILKILNRFRRKEQAAAIFFDKEKAYDKINRNKTFE